MHLKAYDIVANESLSSAVERVSTAGSKTSDANS